MPFHLHTMTKINFLCKEVLHTIMSCYNILLTTFKYLKNLLNICRSDAQKYEVSSMCCKSRPGVQISIFMWWILSDSSFRSWKGVKPAWLQLFRLEVQYQRWSGQFNLLIAFRKNSQGAAFPLPTDMAPFLQHAHNCGLRKKHFRIALEDLAGRSIQSWTLRRF